MRAVKACGDLPPALRIIAEVVAFRLRKLEMANLAGAVAIMAALRLPVADFAHRTVFAALLNVFVYLNNDYRDVGVDLGTPDKDQRKVRYMQRHMASAVRAQIGLFAILCVLALTHSLGLLVALVLGAGICVAYSTWLKRKAYLDVVAMTAWGVAMPLSGTPLDSVLGLCMAGQLGLVSSVFESIQVTRDHDTDRALGVRTTAVALGTARMRLLVRGLMLATAGYAAAVLGPVPGALSLLAPLLPWPAQGGGEATARYWTQVKLVYGAAFLWACGEVFLTGESSGLLLAARAEDTIDLRHLGY